MADPVFRFRVNWRGKLILEVRETVHHCHDLNGSGYFDEYQTVKWRDAKIMDIPSITEIKL